MPKFKNPYSYPLTSRRAMAEYICGIGGYSTGYGGRDRFAIEFNVAAYATDFDFDHIWEKYHKEYVGEEILNDPVKFKAYYDLCRELHKQNEEYLWGWGQEDAARGLSDNDGYRMLWDGEKPFRVEMGLYGRSGKHLCIESFEGHDLRKSPEELLEAMMEQELPNRDVVSDRDTLADGASWLNWRYEDIRNLYKMCRQWEVDFTPAKASAEVEYQGVFSFFANVVEAAWMDREREIAEHGELVEAAKNIWENSSVAADDNMVFDFLLICKTAGISEAELVG